MFDQTFWIVVAVYCVVVGVMKGIGFQKVLDAHDLFWRKVILKQNLREDEYDLSERLRKDDCIGLHRTAMQEEELYGMVVSGELATHLDYCKRYTFNISKSACTHPENDEIIDIGFDGSAVIICGRCGESKFDPEYRRKWELGEL